LANERIVKAKLADGSVILVEARSTGSRQTDVSVRKALEFKGVEDSIKSIAERVSAALKSVRPDRAEVEFGIDVTVESGALTGLLAKGSGTATLKVTLEWTKDA
jgi:hypothetical protein